MFKQIVACNVRCNLPDSPLLIPIPVPLALLKVSEIGCFVGVARFALWHSYRRSTVTAVIVQIERIHHSNSITSPPSALPLLPPCQPRNGVKQAIMNEVDALIESRHKAKLCNDDGATTLA